MLLPLQVLNLLFPLRTNSAPELPAPGIGCGWAAVSGEQLGSPACVLGWAGCAPSWSWSRFLVWVLSRSQSPELLEMGTAGDTLTCQLLEDLGGTLCIWK